MRTKILNGLALAAIIGLCAFGTTSAQAQLQVLSRNYDTAHYIALATSYPEWYVNLTVPIAQLRGIEPSTTGLSGYNLSGMSNTSSWGNGVKFTWNYTSVKSVDGMSVDIFANVTIETSVMGVTLSSTTDTFFVDTVILLPVLPPPPPPVGNPIPDEPVHFRIFDPAGGEGGANSGGLGGGIHPVSSGVPMYFPHTSISYGETQYIDMF